MNRTTQKEMLGDILEEIKHLKKDLLDKKEEVELSFDKVSELGNALDNIGQVESWDEEQLKLDIIQAVVEDSSLDEIHDQLYEFDSELSSYMDEISDNAREKLEERYADLEQVLEMLTHDETDESIENVYDRISEAEDLIKAMRK